ncbi:hypothetical protein [Verrucosispora sp. WMMC514]|uniref:hypothetical protein n=1 Tax=Verrucosispora sp. WMMC514 TaxID=3015156 RepID=UPI00248CADED|nr:hypothetical protein [Verrucosispora sp. WMMC514]WBB94249.1 hypothetical protein O7597_15470 [Verrucosispora sp. WMMC514]
MSDFRLIVTGSRSWDDIGVFDREVSTVADAARYSGCDRLVVVHGACYPPIARHPLDPANGVRPLRSADWLAHLWVQHRGPMQPLPVVEEPHPADWKAPCRPECRHGGRRVHGRTSSCRAAGDYRNTHMVSLGGDAGLAFWDGRSKGTRHCIRAMEAAGIPVKVIRPTVHNVIHSPEETRTHG